MKSTPIRSLYQTIIVAAIVAFGAVGCAPSGNSSQSDSAQTDSTAVAPKEAQEQPTPTLVDEADFATRMRQNANGDTTGLWPVDPHPVPLQEALLPYKRIVTYYGNMYSKQMGALGEYPPEEMWQRLNEEVKRWEAADPSTPVVAGVHYIAVTAQGSPIDGKYRLRMPKHQIDSALAIAKMGNAITFLDIQVGHSTLQEEIPLLEEYLIREDVHLGIDPEFSMKDGTVPGKKIGTFDAKDVNYASDYLAQLVRQHNLPPKVLVVHRFTKGMLTNYQNITLRPEVQIVIDMDGFGRPELKYSTYDRFIRPEPVQFTGFKLFYKNDKQQYPHHVLTPEELLRLSPQPVYIQYQ